MQSACERVNPCGAVCSWCLYYKWNRCGACANGYCAGRKTECPIRDCASKKGLAHCTDCSLFPCMLTYAYFAHMNKWLETLKEQKKKVKEAK